jgi:hypothetical protein
MRRPQRDLHHISRGAVPLKFIPVLNPTFEGCST